jgi:hypothetical protein
VISGLLESNTDLTAKMHALSQHIAELTRQLYAGADPATP